MKSNQPLIAPRLSLSLAALIAALLLRTNGALAQSNIFLGTGAGASNTTGSINVGIGAGALQNNTTGSANSAVGLDSLFSNTTAGEGTAFGPSRSTRTPRDLTIPRSAPIHWRAIT